MKIYIEIAILDNLIVNFVLLSLEAKLFQFNKSNLLVLLSSVIGTFFSIIFPLLKTAFSVLILLKLLLGIVMVYFAFKPKTFKKLIAEFLVFLILTFALGGAILALFNLFNIDINRFILFSYSAIFPISIFVLAVYCIPFLILKLVKFLFNNIKINRNKFKIKITKFGKKFYLNGLFDSGNLLKDENTNLPVCVISSKAFSKIYNEISFIDLVLKKEIKLNKAHYISYSTISGVRNNMLVFMPEKIEILINEKWIEKKIMFGVSLANFSKNQNFDVLLNSMCEV